MIHIGEDADVAAVGHYAITIRDIADDGIAAAILRQRCHAADEG